MSAKRVIRAKDIIADIRGGMTDSELIEKYQLSQEQFQRLRKRLPEGGRIEIKEIVADLRSRATDFELCHKYDVSLEELPLVLEKLVEIGALRGDELKERSAFYDEPEHRVRTRRLERTRVGFELLVYDPDNPSRNGLTRDISERGLRVASFTQDIAEAKRFIIRPEQFFGIRSFDFQVECRWINKRDLATQYFLAGFEITDMSDRSRLEFRKLLQQLRTRDNQIAAELEDGPSPYSSILSRSRPGTERQIDTKKPAPEHPTKPVVVVEGPSLILDAPNFQKTSVNFSEETGDTVDAMSLTADSEEPVTLIGFLREQETADGYPIRALERPDLRNFLIPVFEKGKPETQCSLIDITEKGLGLSGLQATVGDRKTLVILADELSHGLSIEFEATCRWVEEDPLGSDFRSGFELAGISEENLLRLRELISLLAVLV